MVSDDGRVWTGGLVLRVEPDGTRLARARAQLPQRLRAGVDSFGDLWQNDNDDQVMACRTTWLMEGANTGYFSADGTRFWQADRRPGQDTFAAHWHQDDPGVLPAGDNTGAGAPAGVVRYEGDAARAAISRAAAERRRRPQRDVRLTCRSRSGAGFALERFDFVSSLAAPNPNYIWNRSTRIGASGSGRATWPWAPTARSTSPTGSTRSSAAIRCATASGYGRIYRITPKGRALDNAGDRSADDRGSDPGAAQSGRQRPRAAGSSG